jgi:hypothetical protein
MIDPDALRLIKVLDGLPLALATAEAYLNQVSTSLSEYLHHYEASWLKLQQTPHWCGLGGAKTTKSEEVVSSKLR